jgi:acetyltransferase-like isoleucine patch superfamily enzyme
LDTNFHALNSDLRGTVLDRASAMSASILIKEKAFIGGNSIILKGVIIGVNSIVAAGSVVVKSIPDNPAKFIKRIK